MLPGIGLWEVAALLIILVGPGLAFYALKYLAKEIAKAIKETWTQEPSDRDNTKH